jgi:hypothetical protein
MKVLDFYLTKNENSIEEFFAKKFEQCPKCPMDNKFSEIFIKLSMLEDINLNISENDKPSIYKIIEQRINSCHTFKVDDKVLLFLSILCNSVGYGIMYIWYLQYESKKRNINFITFDIFSEIFSWGFPSNETLDKLWINQKVNRSDIKESDNLLDYALAGKTLF